MTTGNACGTAWPGCPRWPRPPVRAAPVKTRVRGDGQSISRFDRGGTGFAEAEITEEMLATIRSADAVLVSDYGRGLTEHGRLRGALAATARQVPVVWDPHPRGAQPVPGVWLATPNAAEAVAAAGIDPEPGPPILSAGPAAAVLRSDWGARAIVVTPGRPRRAAGPWWPAGARARDAGRHGRSMRRR